MGAPAQANLLVLDDGMLRSMMEDPRYLTAFPCISTGKRQLDTQTASAKDCGRCGKPTKAEVRANVITSIYNCITGMSLAQRNEFKRLVNARQIRILRPARNGGTTRITF